MSLCTYYEMLKQSPLAKGKDEAIVEEVAIWLDMNGGSTRANIIKVLKAIEKNYHNNKTDKQIIDDIFIALHKLTKNSMHSISNKRTMLTLPEIEVSYFSDNALYWIFKVFSETSSLDNAMLDEKFIAYAEDAKDKHRDKSMTWKKVGNRKLPYPSHIDQALYEVFAELLDLIKSKLTRTSQSPQA